MMVFKLCKSVFLATIMCLVDSFVNIYMDTLLFINESIISAPI